MANFKSVGTIRYECEGEEPKVKWFFVPDSDHCVKHRGMEYAIFINKNNGSGAAITKELLESRVKLSIQGEEKICQQNNSLTELERFGLSGAQSAAMSQSKVMVIVKRKGRGLSLIGTFPPPK